MQEQRVVGALTVLLKHMELHENPLLMPISREFSMSRFQLGSGYLQFKKNTSYIGLLDIWEPRMDYIHMTWNAKGMERLEMDIQDSYSQLTMLKG